MKPTPVSAAFVTIALTAQFVTAAQAMRPAAEKQNAKEIERGRYMLTVGSCNDCHTAGFAPRNGNVPEKDWLLGEPNLGLSGPWGTTYATNLRLSLSKMTEDEWVRYAKALKARPPMPWFNLNHWAEADLRAFYQYVRHLGPGGQPPAQALPPGQAPKTPVVQWPSPPAAK